MSSFKDHFSTNAADYAAARPVYPRALAQQLAGLCHERQHALDCGCGNGQLSHRLGEFFDRVTGTDASSAQIASARPQPNIHFHAALAEDSGLPDASVDLITVAQAAHWLDLTKFYAEARRVARPGAVLALITYGLFRLPEPMESILHHFYHDTIGRFWPPERRHVDEGYRRLPFPFSPCSLPPMSMQAQWKADDLLAYVQTWSAVKKARQALTEDPIAELAHQLNAAWGALDTPCTVTWPLTVRAGTVP